MSFEREFTWRGLKFVWNGRRHKFEGPDGWWVSHTRYIMYCFNDGSKSPDDLKPEEELMRESQCRFLAHAGRGDGAERDSIREALDAALQYALRYHHQEIAKLRVICYAPEITS